MNKSFYEALAKQLGFILKPLGASEALRWGECDCVRFSLSGFLGWCRGRTRTEQLGPEAERPMRKQVVHCAGMPGGKNGGRIKPSVGLQAALAGGWVSPEESQFSLICPD